MVSMHLDRFERRVTGQFNIPFGGISSRQDTKVLQSLFIQILQQGCQIMSSSPEANNMRPRDVIITRIGVSLNLKFKVLLFIINLITSFF